MKPPHIPRTVSHGDDAPICPHCLCRMWDLEVRFDAMEALEVEGTTYLTVNAACNLCDKLVRIERTVDREDCTAKTFTYARLSDRDIRYLGQSTALKVSREDK